MGNYLNIDLSCFLLVYIGDVGLGLCAPRPGGGLTSVALTQSGGLVESLA